VARLAEALPVAGSPEQGAIAAVRLLVINDGGRGAVALSGAIDAKRVQGQVPCSCYAPFVTVHACHLFSLSVYKRMIDNRYTLWKGERGQGRNLGFCRPSIFARFYPSFLVSTQERWSRNGGVARPFLGSFIGSGIQE
jgi:hypothetical protein